MQKIFNKSNKTILLTTAIYIAYTIFIVIPFLKYAAPQNEGTIDWKFKYAPFVFAGLFYPIFWLWSWVVTKNIFNVRYLRTLIYNLVYIVTFISIHITLLITHPMILIITLVTIPIGILILIGLLITSIIFDIKDFKQKKELSNEKSSIQKISTIIICYITLPLIFIQLILYSFLTLLTK